MVDVDILRLQITLVGVLIRGRLKPAPALLA